MWDWFLSFVPWIVFGVIALLIWNALTGATT